MMVGVGVPPAVQATVVVPPIVYVEDCGAIKNVGGAGAWI